MRISAMLIVILVLSTSCATNAPMLLKSVVGTRNLIQASPSLSMSKDRIVKWATVGYGDAKDLTGLMSEGDLTVRSHFIAGGGLLLQPDLAADWQLAPFVAVAGAGSYSNISVSPGLDSRTVLDSRSVDYKKNFNSLELEASIKPGLVGKFFIGTLSLYGLGYVGYESGSYSRFRRDSDGVGNLYNVDANPVTVGYGLGTDLQFGASDYAAVGIGVDYLWSYNRTQSFVGATLSPDASTYVVETNPDGIQTASKGPAFSPYIEIKNLRLTASIAILSLSNLQVSYRW